MGGWIEESAPGMGELILDAVASDSNDAVAVTGP